MKYKFEICSSYRSDDTRHRISFCFMDSIQTIIIINDMSLFDIGINADILLHLLH